MGCCLPFGNPFLAKQVAVVAARTSVGSSAGSTAAVSLEEGRHPTLESHSDC